MRVTMKELGEIITGNTPSKKIEEFWDSDDICFVKPDIIADSGISIITESSEFISAEAKKKARIVSKDSIFVTCIGSIGKIGIASDGEFAFNQQINAIIPNEKVNAKYLAYNLLFNKPRLIAIANAPVVPIINKSQFGGFTVNIEPDINKQNEIAEVLDKLIHIIEGRNEELSALDDLIKTRFVEMFGDPVSNPYGWDIVAFDDCLESIENGRSFVCDSVARADEKPAILKLSAATYGVYKPKENKAIINEEDFIESAEVHDGDLLFTRKNTPKLVGMAAYVESTPKKLMMPDLIFRLNTKANCNKIFLWKLINHDLYRNRIESAASGSAKSMSNISKERLGKLGFPLPPLEMQEQFADFVKQVAKSKDVVQESLDETQQLFDALMQQYFG